MKHREHWQEFHSNGNSLVGVAGDKAHFSDPSHIMGGANVWMWRRGTNGQVEVLIQKRASDIKVWPGYWDISVAGHIDLDETPTQSAVREAHEEIGLTISEDELHFLFTIRTPLAPNEIDFVYALEIANEFTPNYTDKEVEQIKWISLSTLRIMINMPDDAMLVNQGKHYFGMLLDYFDSL